MNSINKKKKEKGSEKDAKSVRRSVREAIKRAIDREMVKASNETGHTHRFHDRFTDQAGKKFFDRLAYLVRRK